jgi:diacylglycerol kinase (ATP)
VLGAARSGGPTKRRNCLEVLRAGENEPALRGFLLGLGAFVRATEHAQKIHGRGFIDKAAIAITLAGAVGRTLMGGPDDAWRRGEAAEVTFGGGRPERRDWFLVLASTLKRFPLGLRPFGAPHEGLKVLTIEAPPRRLWPAIPAILRGSEADWLETAGYRRTDAPAMKLSSPGAFVLDGEIFPGGDVVVRQGPAVEFVMA